MMKKSKLRALTAIVLTVALVVGLAAAAALANDGVPTVTALRGREMPPDDTPAPDPAPTLEERVTALQAAQADTDSLLVEQEYRLTLLEQGISSTDNA